MSNFLDCFRTYILNLKIVFVEKGKVSELCIHIYNIYILRFEYCIQGFETKTQL